MSQSYILTNATLRRRAEGSLRDMLGSNFLRVDPGIDNVYLLHSFYDPEKHVFDDEINFSLGIALDSTVIGKTYIFHKKSGLARAILGYWHYGPFGGPVLSKSTEGTIILTSKLDGLVSGKMDLTFDFGKRTIRIYGDFYLPQVSFENVIDFQRRLEKKYGSSGQ